MEHLALQKAKRTTTTSMINSCGGSVYGSIGGVSVHGSGVDSDSISVNTSVTSNLRSLVPIDENKYVASALVFVC